MSILITKKIFHKRKHSNLEYLIMSNLPFTLNQLKILQTIAIEGSFKKAAEKLYISQPAISLQIQNLERQLNIPIFYRDKRRARLTETGQSLLKYADRILNLCEETCRGLEEIQTLQSGVLIVGASQTTGTYLMPQLIGNFRHRYPQVVIELQVYSTHRIAWGVANGQIDLAVVGGKIPSNLQQVLDITSYAEDELALILPTSHPFSSLEYIQKEDLYRLRFITLERESTIRTTIENTLSENGIDSRQFKVEMELNSIEAIKNAVQSGLGSAFVPVSTISKELELNIIHWTKIKDITISRTLSLLVNLEQYPSNPIKTFKKEILEMFLVSTAFESKIKLLSPTEENIS